MVNHAPPETTTESATGAVVSDLHLFARRSDGEQRFAEFERSLTGSPVHTLVLNGDTFDFRWSHHRDHATSVAAATRWLTALLERQPAWTVHFLLGNHDCLTGFTESAHAIAADVSRFHVHPHLLQLGANLFLHGDCANRRMDRPAFDRFRAAWSNDRQRGPAAAKLYAAVDATRLSHRFHDWYFPDRLTVSRVAHHLDHVLPGWQETVDACYFGHTHRPVHGLHHGGVRFYNTGSAVRGMPFAPLRFQAPEEAEV